MIVTVSDILKDAMGLCNATEIDETPSSSEMAIALRAANVMIDRWSTQHLMLRSNTQLVVPVTIGKATYTVGPSGADVTVGKPLRVLSGVVVDGGVNFPLDVYTQEMFNNLVDRGISSGRPVYVAYDPGEAQQAAHVGTLSFYYTPDRAYTVRLEAQMYLTELVNFTDLISFEPAYYEALIYQLAIRLFRRYSDDKTPIPADLAGIAGQALRDLKSLNAERVVASSDLPGVKGRYNILTDSST